MRPMTTSTVTWVIGRLPSSDFVYAGGSTASGAFPAPGSVVYFQLGSHIWASHSEPDKGMATMSGRK